MTTTIDPEQQKSDQILYLIGHVVVAWSALDDPLIRLLASLVRCKLRPAGVMYYALNGFKTRCDLLRALAKHNLKNKKEQASLLQFLDKLIELAKVRNDIIHADYPLIYREGKMTMEKHLNRSARDEIHVELKAQTGELETHLKKIESARFWLGIHYPGPRMRSKDRANLQQLINQLPSTE
jgi:hypothetical protein